MKGKEWILAGNPLLCSIVAAHLQTLSAVHPQVHPVGCSLGMVPAASLNQGGALRPAIDDGV